MQSIFGFIVLAVVVWGIVSGQLWRVKREREMTPEQREHWRRSWTR